VAWQAYAVSVIDERRESSAAPPFAAAQSAYGKKEMDAFRTANSALRTRLDQRRDATLRRSGIIWTALVAGLALLFALIGFGGLHRANRRALARSEREVSYRGRQGEFSDLIQAVDSKDEAHELVQRHLQRSLPGASVTVLERNNSDNRLQAATPLPAGSVLAEHLVTAEPRACLAIRLGRTHQDGAGRDELISCGICSHVAGTAMCQPLLVGGKVIGSVLIERDTALVETERRGVTDTVAQAAPVLANLRTIAIAENRASTDALTGLPNRRAMSDTLKRMSAHAGRTAQPLAAIAFDLDGFKSINDRYGHETGDAALSAVGECLRECLRESDFAARTGGEEFLVLAPDTDLEGARVLAEKLRAALSREEVPSLLEPMTASFGVAVMPDHAASSEALLRQADRACYLAKERGRNRVELAGADDAALHVVTR
jgi:diguanylate cyclase (GGDEF)-like protein